MVNVILDGPEGPVSASTQAPAAPEAAAAPTATGAAPAPSAGPASQAPASVRFAVGANGLRYCEDRDGRRIGYRPLDALEDFDLCEIAGAENERNDGWMFRAGIAFAVREIDGEALKPPASKMQVRAMVKRLGTSGMAAVGEMLAALADEDAAKASGMTRAKN